MIVEDIVDDYEHFRGYGDDSSVVPSMFHYSQIELVESGVATCGVLGGFDEDSADVAVAFLCDVPMGCMVAGLACAGCEACVADKFL